MARKMAYQCLPLYHKDVFEPDKEKRPCSIMLNTMPLEAPLLSSATNITVHHWGLVAYFQKGNKLMLFEAGEGKDGKIEVGLANGVWKDDPKIQRFNLGIVDTSPNELLELARRHKFNGETYSATLRNCQDWVKEFVRMISSVLEEAIKKYKTYKEEYGTLDAAISHMFVKSSTSSSFIFSKSYQGSCNFAKKSVQSFESSSASSNCSVQ